MPNPRTIRSYSLYLDDKKFAEMSSADYDVNANSEAQIADGGWIGQSDGAVTTQITGNTIVPVDGTVKDPVSILLSRKYVGVSQLIGGKFHRVAMKFTSAGHSTNHQNGTATGKFTLMGGEPTVTS